MSPVTHAVERRPGPGGVIPDARKPRQQNLASLLVCGFILGDALGEHLDRPRKLVDRFLPG